MEKLPVYALLMFSIFGCFRQKTPPKNIEAWLEQSFPGKYQVLASNIRMLDIMAQFKGEKRAVIADKSDPELQFLLDWQKGETSLGLSPETVTEARNIAQYQLASARELLKLLQQHGLEKYAVGVLDREVFIQVFAEPDPAARKRTSEVCLDVLNNWKKSAGLSFRIQFMEPAEYRAKFQDIIPSGHFFQETGWQRRKEIMSLRFDWDHLKNTSLHWEINPESERAMQFSDFSFEQAQAWGEKNLPKPFFMERSALTGFEIIKHPGKNDQTPPKNSPAVRYGFPYFAEKLPAEKTGLEPDPIGYVTGIYSYDDKTFTQIRKQVEF